jgi:hypothetical protein
MAVATKRQWEFIELFERKMTAEQRAEYLSTTGADAKSLPDPCYEWQTLGGKCDTYTNMVLADALNLLSEDGWELVCSYSQHTEPYFLLRRPKGQHGIIALTSLR